jgi:cobalamin-dependent methionine synthase I
MASNTNRNTRYPLKTLMKFDMPTAIGDLHEGGSSVNPQSQVAAHNMKDGLLTLDPFMSEGKQKLEKYAKGKPMGIKKVAGENY